MSREQAYIGLDIGGTNMRAMVVARSGPTGHRLAAPAGGLIPADELFATASDLIGLLRRDSAGYDIAGVGVGLCGALVDGARLEPGMSNLPNLVGIDLADVMPRHFGLPCSFGNDAQAAMLAESRFGAITGVTNAICIALGTGIGSGLLLGGKLHRGASARAGEIGPWSPDLAISPSKTLEERAAPGSILKRSGRELGDLIGAAGTYADAAREAASFFNHVGGALANIQLLLDLEAAVICGGVTGTGDALLSGILAAFESACPAGYRRNFSIRLSAFGGWGPAVGAACFCMEEP